MILCQKCLDAKLLADELYHVSIKSIKTKKTCALCGDTKATNKVDSLDPVNAPIIYLGAFLYGN